MIEVRKAQPEDALAISKTRILVWEETYRGIYPDEKLEDYDISSRAEEDRLHLSSPQEHYYLFMDGSACVGFFSFGSPHYEPCKDHTLCLNHLYILRAYQKLGLGRQAFDIISAYCRQNAIPGFFCGCHRENKPALSFYRHMGGKLTEAENASCEHLHFEFYLGDQL